ncbi:unnamed protein product [Arctia plantaginis]|uniref:Uncharacterized protein n=1 Tax=Arctia plantaginis TaxID=874455 RepID=A0A8S1AEP5_ARCPL|nr:unnamed protein product [Arctia plantaginis]
MAVVANSVADMLAMIEDPGRESAKIDLNMNESNMQILTNISEVDNQHLPGNVSESTTWTEKSAKKLRVAHRAMQRSILDAALMTERNEWIRE